MPNMSLEVVLRLVDQLTGPMRGAATALDNFADAAEKIGGGGPKPDGWVQQQQEIDKATGKVENYKSGVSGAADMINYATTAVLSFVAAHSGLELVEHAIEAGAAGAHNAVAMETSGMKPDEIIETQARARELSKDFPSLTQSEIEQVIIAERSSVRPDQTAEIIPKLLALLTIDKAKHPGAPSSLADFVEGLKIAGATENTKTFDDYIELSAQAMNASDKITLAAIDEFFRRVGSLYARNLDPAFVFGAGLTLIKQDGASLAGTTVKAFEEEVFAARLSGKPLEELVKLGLIGGDPSKVTKRDKEGRPTEIEAGAITGTELALHNEEAWVRLYLKPALDKLPPEQRDEAEGIIFGPRAKAGVDTFLTRGDQIAQDTKARQGAMGAGAAEVWENKDPATAREALQSQFVNWLGSAGEPYMAGLRADMEGLRRTITAEVEATRGHEWINALLGGAAALGGGALGYATLTKGVGWLLRGVLGGVAAGVVKEVADVVDPKGTFWGLTTPIDAFAKRHFGFDPSNLLDDPEVKRDRARRYDPNAYGSWRAVSNSLQDAGYTDASLAAESSREASRARALSPSVDASALDAASTKAKQANQELQALGAATVAPKVDSSALDTLLTKLREALASVVEINGGLSTAGRRASYAGALHDGPEAR